MLSLLFFQGFLTLLNGFLGGFLFRLFHVQFFFGGTALGPTFSQRSYPFIESNRQLAGAINDLDPGDIRKHGETNQEKSQQNECGPKRIQGVQCCTANLNTQDTPSRITSGGINIRQRTRGHIKMDISKASRGDHSHGKTQKAKTSHQPAPAFIHIAEHQPGPIGYQQGKQIRQVAKQGHQYIGTPGTGASSQIMDTAAATQATPAGVMNIKRGQCNDEIQ